MFKLLVLSSFNIQNPKFDEEKHQILSEAEPSERYFSLKDDWNDESMIKIVCDKCSLDWLDH